MYGNLSNSSREAVNRVSSLTVQPVEFIKGDIRNCKKNLNSTVSYPFKCFYGTCCYTGYD